MFDLSCDFSITLSMEELIAKNISPASAAILIAALIYVTKSLYEFISTTLLKAKDKTDENTQAVRELNLNINHLTNRLVLVEASIDKFTEVQASVIKLDKDVTFAHEKIREIKSELR